MKYLAFTLSPAVPRPVALRGATKQYREKGCFSILLPCVLQRKI